MISIFRIGLSRFNFKLSSVRLNPINRNFGYNFSSKKLYELKDSKFSQQLGLDKQMNTVSKNVKSQQSSLVKSFSMMIIFVATIIGSYSFIQIIDRNQTNFWKYQYRYFKNSLRLNKKKSQMDENLIDLDYQKNLKQVYDKKFKNRTKLDSKFVIRLYEYVKSKISKININKNQVNFRISQNLQYVLMNLMTNYSEQNGKKNSEIIKQTFQAIVLYGLSSRSQKIINSENTKKLCVFLLKYGDINQQILGLKFLNSSKPMQKISKQFINQIIARININQNKKQDDYDNQTNKKILTPKQQMVYSIQEMKKVNKIRKQKIRRLKQYFKNYK